MAYDKHGNYDYEASAAETQFKPRLAQRLGEGLSQARGCVVMVFWVTFIVALAVGLTYGALYAGGRAVGAGVRDARGQK